MHPNTAPTGGHHGDFDVVAVAIGQHMRHHDLHVRNSLWREEPPHVVLIGRKLRRRNLQHAIDLVGPEHGACLRIDLPSPHRRHGLGCFQQLARPLEFVLGLNVIGDVCECPDQAASGQGLGLDLNRAALRRGSQILRRKWPVTSGRHIVTRVGVHQGGLIAKIPAIQLQSGDFRQRRAGAQKAGWQIQQFANAGIERNHAPIFTHHENALTDTTQHGDQQLGQITLDWHIC